MAEFFALQHGGASAPLYRLKLEAGIQEALTGHFQEGIADYSAAGQVPVHFDDPTRMLEAHEHFTIAGFPLPENLKQIGELKDTTSLPILKQTMLEKVGLKTIIAWFEPATFAFQAMDKRQVMGTGPLSLLLSKNTFKQLTIPAVQIGPDVHAFHRDGQLTFWNLGWARKLFDMEVYVQEATDMDITAFVQDAHIAVADPAKFRGQCDQWVRLRLKRIMNSGIVKTVGIPDLRKEAELFGIAIQSQTDEGGNERLSIPDEKQQLKVLLKFLEEDYYIGVLSKRRFIANSKYAQQ